jgi:hypothetical protein
MLRIKLIAALLLTVISAALILAASLIPVHAPPDISPYVRPEDIDISLGKLRQIALQDFARSFPLFIPTRQEEYIVTIGQWFSISGGGMLVDDRRIPVYILRVYGDRGYIGTTGLRAGVIERVVLINERRVLQEAVGAAQMLAPIDIMQVDMGTELPPAMKTRLAQQRATPVPSPEVTAEAQP